MMMQPPSSDSVNIYLPWLYPIQINVGFMSQWLPILSNINTTVSFQISQNSTKTSHILYNVSGNSYIYQHDLSYNVSGTSYLNPTDPSLNRQYITGIILTKSRPPNGIGGIQYIHFPKDPKGTYRYAYVYYDPAFLDLSGSFAMAGSTGPNNIGGVNYLESHYGNNNITNIPIYTYFPNFLQSGPPSAPQYLSLSNIGINTPIAVSYIQPIYDDSINLILYPNPPYITNYQVIYSSQPSPIRYGDPVNQSSTIVDNSLSLLLNITNIYPDSSYTILVSAKNNSYNGYGESNSSIIFTRNLSPTISNISTSTVTFPQRYYSGSIYLVGTTRQITTLVNSSLNWQSNNFNVPIHQISNRGSTAQNLMNLTFDLSYVDLTVPGSPNPVNIIGPNISYGGFPATNPGPITSQNLGLNTNSVTDSYSSQAIQNQGFYLQTSNNIVINSQIFKSSPIAYNGRVTETQLGTNTGSSNFSFYYENISGNANMTSISFNFNNTSSYAPVSGINVIYGTPSFNTNVVASNMGTYFYKSPFITFNYTINPNGPSNNYSLSNDTYVTNKKTVSYNGQTYYYYDSSIDVSYTLVSGNLNTIYGNSISIYAVAYNVNGPSSFLSATSINCIVDGPSYVLVYQTFAQTIQNIGTDTPNTGYRIWSAPGMNNDYTTNNPTIPNLTYNGTPFYQIQYDNTASINITPYTNDLQVSNGSFQTLASAKAFNGLQPGYIDYRSYYYNKTQQNTFNYTISDSLGGYRYATFVWKAIYPSGGGSYNTLSVTLNGLSNPTIFNGSLAYADQTNKILLFYRFEDKNNLIPNGNVSTTNWIDGNNNYPYMVNSANYFRLSPTGFPFYGNTTIQNDTSSSTKFNLTIPVAFPFIYIDNIYIYVRVGLPMNSNYTFKTITAKLSSS